MKQTPALLAGERLERGSRERVRDPVQLDHLGATGRGQAEALRPPVGRVGLLLHEPVALERPQQARQVAGVEPEPRTDVARGRSLGADLEQHARLAERSVAEVAVAQRPDLTRDEAVEGADGGDVGDL